MSEEQNKNRRTHGIGTRRILVWWSAVDFELWGLDMVRQFRSPCLQWFLACHCFECPGAVVCMSSSKVIAGRSICRFRQSQITDDKGKESNKYKVQGRIRNPIDWSIARFAMLVLDVDTEADHQVMRKQHLKVVIRMGGRVVFNGVSEDLEDLKDLDDLDQEVKACRR